MVSRDLHRQLDAFLRVEKECMMCEERACVDSKDFGACFATREPECLEVSSCQSLGNGLEDLRRERSEVGLRHGVSATFGVAWA